MAFVFVPPGQPKVEVRINAYPGGSDPGPFPVPTRRSKAGRRTSDASPPRVPAALDDVQRGKPSLDANTMGSSSIQRIGSCTSFID
jgi:hypothetical protein